MPRKTAYGVSKKFYNEIVLNYDGDECLFWPFSKIGRGYGKMRKNGKQGTVHRYLCEDIYGPPPTNMHQAAHSCGKGYKGCVAKRHLSWKTPAENQADRVAHGTDIRGEKHGNSKLTESQVIEILFSTGKKSQSSLAKRYGVTVQAISLIQHRKNWKHIDVLDKRACGKTPDRLL